MMRQGILALAAIAALIAGPGFAQDFEADILAQLRGQGYAGIALSHTWLGRTRIVATLRGELREIVFDPNTGEILRDLSRTVMADNGFGSGGNAASSSTGGTSAGTSVATAAGVNGAATGTRMEAATALDAGVATGSATQGQTNLVSGPTGGSTGTQIGIPFQILQSTGGQ